MINWNQNLKTLCLLLLGAGIVCSLPLFLPLLETVAQPAPDSDNNEIEGTNDSQEIYIAPFNPHTPQFQFRQFIAAALIIVIYLVWGVYRWWDEMFEPLWMKSINSNSYYTLASNSKFQRGRFTTRSIISV